MSGAGNLISAALLVLFVSTSSWPAASFDPPEWAYPQSPRNFKPDPDDGKPKRLVGSTRSYVSSGGEVKRDAQILVPGKMTELMKPIAAQLNLQEMIDIAAYMASRMT